MKANIIPHNINECPGSPLRDPISGSTTTREFSIIYEFFYIQQNVDQKFRKKGLRKGAYRLIEAHLLERKHSHSIGPLNTIVHL